VRLLQKAAILCSLLTVCCEKPSPDTKIVLQSTTHADSGDRFEQAFKVEPFCTGLSLQKGSPTEAQKALDLNNSRWALTYYGATTGGMLFDAKSPSPFTGFGSHSDVEAARTVCSIVKQRVWKVKSNRE
jgi:hypothetical protein